MYKENAGFAEQFYTFLERLHGIAPEIKTKYRAWENSTRKMHSICLLDGEMSSFYSFLRWNIFGLN